MASVKREDTKPEMRVRSFLHARGLRYRLHDNKLPGKPDLVFPKFHTVLFIHGCFWHGHPDEDCKLARLPKSNTTFWINKILSNQNRDKRNATFLQKLGWNVVVVWECQASDVELLEGIVFQITSHK